MPSLRVAFSPCPNDTFLFYAWIHRKIPSPLEIIPYITDLEELNRIAKTCTCTFPLIKVSMALLPEIHKSYFLLPVGAALGENCGPKIIAQRKEIPLGRIAIPGEMTTAHLLLKRLQLPVQEKVFCRYDEIFSLLQEGRVDTGLIIHESRFTFAAAGLYELFDLGELWGGLLPLGGLVVEKDFPWKKELIHTLTSSLQYAFANPEEPLAYMLSLSQEKDPLVIQKHVETYVTQETLCLSDEGKNAIRRLLGETCDFCPSL